MRPSRTTPIRTSFPDRAGRSTRCGNCLVFYYTGRWAIEVVFRETKQSLGMDDPQARKKEAVLRIVPFCLWLNSLIKVWFLTERIRTFIVKSLAKVA